MSRQNVHVTSLEKVVKEYLNNKKVDYIFQCPTKTGFVIDFALLKERTAIEVDGEKWHSSKEAMKRDRFKDYQLKREGWKVIRIKEKEINNLSVLLSSING